MYLGLLPLCICVLCLKLLLLPLSHAPSLVCAAGGWAGGGGGGGGDTNTCECVGAVWLCCDMLVLPCVAACLCCHVLRHACVAMCCDMLVLRYSSSAWLSLQVAFWYVSIHQLLAHVCVPHSVQHDDRQRARQPLSSQACKHPTCPLACTTSQTRH